MARQARPWYHAERGWWMVTLGGKRHKLARGKQNKKAATLRFHELQVLLARNPHPDSPEQTVASVIDTYQTSAKKSLGKRTLEIRLPYQQSFAEAHGWRLVSQVKPLHMTQWIDSHPSWKSDWTKSSAARNVKVAFSWAEKQELIPADPFRRVTYSNGPRRRNITPEEFQAILRNSSSRGGRKKLTPAARFRQILLFLWFTGARPGEAVALKWPDVNFQSQSIRLLEHKTSRTQQNPQPRIIYLHPIIVKLLTAIRNRDEGEHVFVNFKLTPWNRHTLGHRVRRARQQAGVAADAKLYGVRHAFGTRAVKQKIELKAISELMGHTNTRQTEYYVHLAADDAHLAAAMHSATPSRRDS